MSAPPIKERTPIKDLQKVFHYTDTMSRKPTRDNDPYEYLAGFGNRFQSEVIPGTLPAGQNNPQEPRFGLYAEGITYSAFTAPRHANFSTYMYRVRPAAAHSTSLLIIFNNAGLTSTRWIQGQHSPQSRHRKLLPFSESQSRHTRRAGRMGTVPSPRRKREDRFRGWTTHARREWRSEPARRHRAIRLHDQRRHGPPRLLQYRR